jgi:hypothetical protein
MSLRDRLHLFFCAINRHDWRITLRESEEVLPHQRTCAHCGLFHVWDRGTWVPYKTWAIQQSKGGDEDANGLGEKVSIHAGRKSGGEESRSEEAG